MIPTGPILFKTHVSYGGGIRASAERFDGGSISIEKMKEMGLSVARHPSGGSLLACSFNAAWCTALNLQEDGWDIRYFVMLHDDIVPEENWIGILLEDLESSGADMVSAVVPLKDPSGNTSTAIDLEADHYADGGHWGVQRRVTLTEAHRLKPVFNAEDCGYVSRRMLANTGCWICRFDRSWRKEVDEFGRLKVFFTINDRISQDQNTKRWKPDVEPEDWFFSRRLQELGGKVAITTRVKLAHYGMTPYVNFCDPVEGKPYGEKAYDSAHGERVGYKAIGDEGPVYNTSYESKEMADVQGFMNDDEGRLLAKYAEGKRVLEIGSYYGRSTIWMGRTAESVLAVDTWNAGGQDTLKGFIENVNRHGLGDKIASTGGTIQEVKRANGLYPGAESFNPEFGPFDFIFIDANHDFEAVQTDIEESLPLLAPGGLMAFHDYDRPSDPGVKRAVDLLISGGASVVERAGTVIILRVTNAERIESEAGGFGTTCFATGSAPYGVESTACAGPIEPDFAAVCTW